MGKTNAPPLDGGVIRRARLGRFLTQQEVAEQCAALGVKIDRSGISQIESGYVKWPSLKVIPAIAQVLGLDVGEMFHRDDEQDATEAA